MRNWAFVCTFLCLLPAGYSQVRAEFEVASIKPNTGDGAHVFIGVQPGGRLNAERVPLRFLVRFAYNVKDFQISGGPSWMNSDRYDVSAKADGNVTPEQMRPMLQSLLADRFKLTLHRETKDLPIYELVAAKGGLKLAASKEGSCITPNPNNPPAQRRPGDPPPHYCGNIGIRGGLLEAFAISMPRLLTALSDTLGRTVIDKTGFAGTFDVHLEFTPDETTVTGPLGTRGVSSPDAVNSDAPSIFTALQEQLGLRLESAKGPVEMLVIDHVERPSEN